jgi:hypothetical protein
MQTWLWGEKCPGFMDVLVPMASQPTAMASRNWMLRRMMIETIRSAPELAARPDADASDLIYQYDSARDYDPSPAFERHRSHSACHQFPG